MTADSNRRLILRLRKQIKPKRRLDAMARVGLVVFYRCLECGTLSRTTYSNEFEAKKMSRWHSKDMGGCSGTCRRCTKAARDRIHPLPMAKR